MQNNGNKKKYLERYLELKEDVEREDKDAGYWKEKAYSISAIRLDLSGVRSHNHSNYRPIDKYLEIAERCALMGEKMQNEKEEIIAAINTLDNTNQRIVLKLRYVSGLDFLEIAQRLGYTIGNVFKIHRKALDNFVIPESL